MTARPTAPARRVAGLTKFFGTSNALSDVSFDVERGDVHALVGENGAGKCTLVKIITGILEPNAGQIELLGQPVRFATPVEARRAGVAAVCQDPKLFPHLDVAEHISMGAAPVTAIGAVDRKAVVARARNSLAKIGVRIDPHALVAELRLAGKLDLKPGTKFTAGKAGEYTVGEHGEIVYGKPLLFTKDNVDKYNF